MKANSRPKVPGNRIREAVPPAYRAAAAKEVRPDGVLIVGTIFTEKAQALACMHNARSICLRTDKWQTRLHASGN